MSPTEITRAHAEGMLRALQATHDHDCLTVVTGYVPDTQYPLGKGLPLRCLYACLDLAYASDLRIVASLYASAARAAIGRCEHDSRDYQPSDLSVGLGGYVQCEDCGSDLTDDDRFNGARDAWDDGDAAYDAWRDDRT